MNITDEKLSAFLDAELPEAEMEIIREQLILDENLTNRLAELAMVDEVVAASYARIDSRPLPDSIAALLTETQEQASLTDKVVIKEKPKTAKIIAFPGLQQFQQVLQKNMAVAAGVVMVLGLAVIQVIHESNSADDWQNVANILETSPSGVTQISDAGTEIKPRVTFINKQGEYCRQFDMNDKKVATENIACRKGNEWKIAVSVTLVKEQEVNSYQTASGGSLLDSAVDDMATSDFFDAQTESAVIERHWKPN